MNHRTIRWRPLQTAMLVLLITAPSLGTHAADDYAALAGALSSPSSLKSKEAKRFHSDAKVMLRLESARLTLLPLQPSEDYLRTVRDEALEALSECNASMERLRQLDHYMPDIGRLAASALPAAPGLATVVTNQFNDSNNQTELGEKDKDAIGQFAGQAIGEGINWAVNKYEAAQERVEYTKKYWAARKRGRDAIVKACAYRYKEVPTVPSSVTVDIDGSWNNTFTNDWIALRNDARHDLTNCTLIVNLRGNRSDTGAAEADSHVHFIAHWPVGQWLYASYPSRCATGIASDESVDCIASATITVYSDQLCSTVEYVYQGEEATKDIQRYVRTHLDGKGTFSGRWYNKYLWYDNGFDFQYNGDLSQFPVTFITVEARRGKRHTSVRWRPRDSRMWSGSGGHKWLSDERFNGWDPDEVEVTFEFPKTDYKYSVVWDLRNK